MSPETLSVSKSWKHKIRRKGSAGTLYLTIAPITGVVHPMRMKSMITNDAQNKTRFQLMFLSGFMKMILTRVTMAMNAFSKPAKSIMAEVFSPITGLKKELENACGAAFIKLIKSSACTRATEITLPDS